MDIRATKIALIRMILGIENSSVIQRISALVKDETTDVCDELTPAQQKDLEKAIQELDAGKGAEWKEFKKLIA